MSTGLIVLAAAGLTYVSRLAAMVFLPAPRGWLAEVVERLPAPLFAALAAVSLLDDGQGLPPPPILAAAAGALLVAPRRSLLLTLVAGLGAFAVVTLLTGGF